MPTRWYQGKVTAIKDLTAETKQFSVEIQNEEDVFDFLPGQFVTFDLPVSDKRLNRWRSYSIANHPDQSNTLEFCIVRSADGLATKYLFEEATVGTMMKFKGPDGGFVLPKDLYKEIVFICTGTGIAPFRSMLNHIKARNLDFQRVNLIFGTRYDYTILYEEELKEMKAVFPQFDYSIALSRQNTGQYHHGYVHDIYQAQFKEVDANRHFYLCGWSSMIDEAVSNLIVRMGYAPNQIHYELYG